MKAIEVGLRWEKCSTFAAYGQRYRSEEEKMQHVVPLYLWHEGVASGIIRSGERVSCDGAQVDMLFFDLGSPKKSIDALLWVDEVDGRRIGSR